MQKIFSITELNSVDEMPEKNSIILINSKKMRLSILAFLLLACITTNAQTSKELIGKWKLVKETIDGKEKTPENTYQVFKEGGRFVGITAGSSMKGKWRLSADNKELTVKLSLMSITFSVDYFDAKKRVITSKQTGTLEYVKVED